MISEHDISTNDLKGTGEAGKITKNDVLELINGTSTEGPEELQERKCHL